MRERTRVTYLGLFLALAFALAGWLTLGDYGITWDEPENFLAGDLYWAFWRTGDRAWLDFEGLKNAWALAEERPYFYVYTVGRQERYPPFVNTVSAIGAWVLHDVLGWLDPIDAHHAVIPLFGALAVWVVFRFAWEGRRRLRLSAALIAALGLGTFPLFWAHAHNNIKDLPQAALFAATMWACWRAFRDMDRVRPGWAIAAGALWGLTLATKANALTVPLILAAWLVWRAVRGREGRRPMRRWWSLLIWLGAFVLIGGGVLVAVWPYLWADPVRRLYTVLRYFAGVGRGQPVFFAGRLYQAGVDLPWYYAGANLVLTTPPVILALALLGLIRALRETWKGENTAVSLWLIWFAGTLARVSLPGMVIYDGLRQIMEILPAWALLAGLGAEWCWDLTRAARYRLGRGWRGAFAGVVLVGIFLPQGIMLARLHPYEGIYHNFLAGGMAGAAQRYTLEYWGQSYQDGAAWLNEHAGAGAWVAVPIAGHLARFSLRPDLELVLTDAAEDLENREGEGYVMLMHHRAWYGPEGSLSWQCAEEGNPLFVLEREGAALLSIYGWPCAGSGEHVP